MGLSEVSWGHTFDWNEFWVHLEATAALVPPPASKAGQLLLGLQFVSVVQEKPTNIPCNVVDISEQLKILILNVADRNTILGNIYRAPTPGPELRYL